VHLGAVTNLSNGGWKQPDKFTWGTQPAAAKAQSLGNNRWQFTITGSLRTYFNITNTSETIIRIGILFRDGAGTDSKVQRNANGSDMYVPVYTNALGLQVLEPPMQPLFNPAPEAGNLNTGTNTFKVAVNKPATVTINAGNGNIQTQAVTNEHVFTVNYTTPGFYTVSFTATAGAETSTTQFQYTVGTVSSPLAPLPAGVREGINYEADQTAATLVLYAPGKDLVSVIGDFNNWTESNAAIMNKTADGKFWIRLTGLTPGTEYAYQYKVDNSLKIADPYTQKVLDPAHDGFITPATYPNLKAYPTGKTEGIVSVLQTAAPIYNWSMPNFSRPDKRGLIIYELLLRDFLAAHDWKTLSDTLNYLKKLGVNAIELMPANEFEGNSSWGYNTSFFFAPDKYYGPRQTLKAFIDSAHKRGIAVILDIALNHHFGQSPMVQLYFDRSTGRPTAANPWFNPVAKHPYNVGYDMNHESAATKTFVGRVLEHWLTEYKIDGYRFDLTKGFTQTQSCDNNGQNCNEGLAFARDPSRIAILKGYYDTVQLKSPGAYAIMEHFTDNSEEKELADYGMMLWANMWTQYQEAAMGWVTAPGQNSNLTGVVHSTRNWNQPHLVGFMESHDEERVMFKVLKYGNNTGTQNVRDTTQALKRMELASAFLFTVPGPKMIWQFGELGYDYSRCYLSTNGEDGNCDKKLDPKPIRWDYLGQARRRQLYDAYSRQIGLRCHPWYKDLFQSGTISHNLVGAIKTLQVASGDTSRMVVVGNFEVNAATATVTFPVSGTWYDYMNNTTLAATGSAQTIALQPGEYRIYLNRNVNNTTPTSVLNIPVSGNVLEAKVYPNPIRANYTVELYVPQSGAARFELLNTSGQVIGTLYDQFLVKGKHQVLLNRKNFDVAPGTYFIRISAKGAQKTIQVTLQ
jgi:1,4-alpha-glucan branching enzyme